MKKLLIPSVLAGLLICSPTSLVRADPVVYYSPYDWDNTVVTTGGTYTGGGITRTVANSATPSPAGLLFSLYAYSSAATGTNAYAYGEITAVNETTWEYTGGGSPVNYDEVPIFQYSASVDGVGLLGYSGYINTYNPSVSPHFTGGNYGKTSAGTTGSPLAQFTTSNPRTGQLYINARINGFSLLAASSGDSFSVGSSTTTGLVTSQVDYIVP